jgi:hypothetical protein
MSPNRRTLEEWWRAPVASILLVIAGLAVIFIEVWRGDEANAIAYSAGLALVGLGITGRIQHWAVGAPPPPPRERPDDEAG